MNTHDDMTMFTVLYTYDLLFDADGPLVYQCWAEDYDHAEEQFVDAEPEGNVLWISETDEPSDALEEWLDDCNGYN